MEEKRVFPGFIDLVKQSWAIYTGNLKLFLKLVAISIASFISIGLLGAVIFAAIGAFEMPAMALLIVLVISTVLALIIIQIWIQLSLILSIKLISGRHRPSSIKKLLSKAKTMVLPLVGISLISSFLIMGGYFLFGIPGVLFSIWFSFVNYVLVDEGKRGMTALLTSRDYMKGFALKVLFRWFLFGLLTSLVSWLPSFILEQADLKGVSSIYSILVGLALTPLSMIFGFLLYKAVKVQKPDLKPDLSRNRKLKYIGVALLGYLVTAGVILFLVQSVVLPSYEALGGR